MWVGLDCKGWGGLLLGCCDGFWWWGWNVECGLYLFFWRVLVFLWFFCKMVMGLLGWIKVCFGWCMWEICEGMYWVVDMMRGLECFLVVLK